MSEFSKIFQVAFVVMTQSRQQRVLLATVMATIAATAVGSAIFPVFFSLGIDALSGGPDKLGAAVTYVMTFGIGFIIVGVLEQIQWLTFGPLNLLGCLLSGSLSFLMKTATVRAFRPSARRKD